MTREEPGTNRAPQEAAAAKRTSQAQHTAAERERALRDNAPRATALLDAAIRSFADDQRRTLCGHARDTAALFVCAHHVAAGAMCVGCCLAHAARHTTAVEMLCDECGGFGGGAFGLVQALHCYGLPMLNRRGRPGALWAIVSIVGVGVCRRCYAGEAAA